MDFFWLILLVCVLGAYPALLLATLIHEIGHAVFASLAEYQVTSLGLGYGKRLFSFRLPGGTIFYVCREHLGFGNCWTIHKELIVSRWRESLRLLGGALTNFLVAGLFLTQFFHPLGWLYTAFALFNLFVGFTNIAPFRLDTRAGVVATDGVKFMRLLLSRRTMAEHPGMAIQYRPIWDEIGDTRALRYHLLRAAIGAQSYGWKDAADKWLTEAEQLPPDTSDAHLLYLRALLSPDGGERKHGLLQIASEEYHRIGSESGVFMTAVSRYFDGTPEDREEVELYVMGHPLLQRPDIANRIAGTRLGRFLRNSEKKGDFAELETLLARFEATRRRHRSDIIDWAVYANLAVWRKENGDEAGALLAWEKARKAMHDIVQVLLPHKEFVSELKKAMTEQAVRYSFPAPFADTFPAKAT